MVQTFRAMAKSFFGWLERNFITNLALVISERRLDRHHTAQNTNISIIGLNPGA